MSAPFARLQLRQRVELAAYPIAAAWSPDAAALVIGTGEGQLHLLARDDKVSSTELLGEHAGGVLALSWQAAGMRFASSGQDGSVRLWDARTRAATQIHRGPLWVEHLAFSGNGRWLAAAAGRDVLLFDSAGALQHTVTGQPGNITALAWRPKAQQLATVSNGGLRLHQVDKALGLEAYDWAGACLTASWSPDARTLASGMQDGSLHFWRLAAQEQSQMRGYGAKVAHTGWSANSRYLASAANQQLVVWDFSGRGPEGSTPLQFDGHSARITSLAYRPAGAQLVTGGRDWRLMLWRPGAHTDPEDAHLLGGEVVLLAWSRDGRWLAAGDSDGTLSIFEFTNG